MATNSYAQLKINNNIELDAYKYIDIPYLIFFVNISSSDSNEFRQINDILFITQLENPSEKKFSFYISSSLEKIPPRIKNREGIIAFRGNYTNFILQSSVNNSKITSNQVQQNKYDNYKEQAYALALILSLESYKSGDTLVNYYYKKYYKDNISGMKKIQDDISLEYYLEGALIRAKNIFDNGKEDLSIPEIKAITEHYRESRINGNNDTIFSRSLRNYYIDLAKYYSRSDKKEYKIIAGYYQDAKDIDIDGETFENSDMHNFADALFFTEQDIWAEEGDYNFETCKGYYEKLMKKNYKTCDIYLKLGAIYYMENYENGDFSESKKYFNKVIENNCYEQKGKAENNLKKIEELERKNR
jgi:hypothetical protein